MEPIREKIVLEMDAGSVKGNSLEGLIKQLDQVEIHIQKVNAALNGMNVGPNVARSVTAIEAQINKLKTRVAASGGDILKPADLSKALGFDPAGFERHLAQNATRYKDAIQKSFRSVKQAAVAASSYERQTTKYRRMALGDLATPTVSSVQQPSGPVNVGVSGAKVEGMIQLVIPASQVVASVSGPITASGQGGAASGGTAGGGGSAKGSKGTKSPKGKGPLDIGEEPGELHRVRTETDKYLREAVTAVDAAGDIITTTHDSVEGIIKTSQKHVSGQTPLAAYRDARRLAEENFKQAKAALDPNDPGFGLARVLDKQAAQLKTLLSPTLRANLGDVQAQSIENLLKESSTTLEAQAAASRVRATAAIQEQAKVDFARRKKQAAQGVQGELAASRAEMEAGLKEAKAGTGDLNASGVYRERARRLQTALAGSGGLIGPGQRRQVEAAIRSAEANALLASGPPPLPKPVKPKPTPEDMEERANRNRMSRGISGLTTIGGFASNLLNVAAWAAPVTVLYKGFELASHSLSRFIEIGKETAQLGQVFRGVGGTAQQLTGDILQLASAEGRDTEEGMASAKEWARLGLTRTQVNEAVRVSMEAANVADMHTTETTKQLSSLMHVYGLEVGDLAGVLGILTSTSQRYNVTLEDLFLGLDRSAGVAKQAGMSLAELQGMIGAVVGKTGQSGVIVGNGLKNLLVQFNDPAKQKLLRGFGIETTTAEGAQKGGSQVLREMFIQYQKMNSTQQQSLMMSFGRLPAARNVALMENYIESQKLAIEGQLHLNSAQEANAKILGTVKAQLAGVRAEWDRFIVGTMTQAGPGGSPSLGQQLFEGLRLGKNVLRGVTGSGVVGRFGSAFLGSSLPGAGLLQYLPGMINRALETPLERGRARFGNEVQEHQNAAAGNLELRRAFGTASEVLGVALTQERRNTIAEQTAGMLGAQGGTFTRMVRSGDIAGAQGILSAAGQAAQQRALQEKVKEAQSRTKLMTIAGSQAEAAKEEIANLEQAGDQTERLTKAKERYRDAQQTITDLTKDATAALTEMNEEDAGQIGDAFARKQEYVSLLKEQQMLMEAIGQLASQQTLDTPASRNEAAVQGLEDQKRMLEAEAERLSKRNEPGMDKVGPLAEVRKRQLEVEAELAARQSPGMTAALGMLGDRSLAERRAAQEGELGHVGRTEGEKLLNQERALQGQLGGMVGRRLNGGLGENDTVRAKEFEIQLWRTQEQIQTRILELARQERQIRIDAAREFQKNLLLAGPAEQLQRLYVGSLLSRKGGVSFGEFNSLSPELKRMYYEARGGEAGALAREEMGALRGHGQSIEQQQAAQARAGGRVSAWGGDLAGFARSRIPTNGMPLPSYAQDEAKKAGENLGVLAKSAAWAFEQMDLLTGQMMLLNKVINGMVGGGGNGGKPNTTPPKMSLGLPHSMGAGASW